MSQQTINDLLPREVAAIRRVSLTTVLGWIRSGQLKASNVAPPSSQRPRWRITPGDLQALREKQKRQTPKVSRRRRQTPADVTEYFCEADLSTVRILP